MDSKTYQQEVQRTVSNNYYGENVDNNLLHAAIGLVTESGEMIDAIKKSLFYGKPLDIVNVKEELGDIAWYLALACESLGTDLPTVFQKNIDKLKARYPNKFSLEAAENRDLIKEREILEREDVLSQLVAEAQEKNMGYDLSTPEVADIDFEPHKFGKCGKCTECKCKIKKFLEKHKETLDDLAER